MQQRNMVVGLLALLFSSWVWAASPVGEWTTIDDKTHKPRGVMKLTLRNGQLSGRLVNVYVQKGDINKCVKCKGRFKNVPILGMTNMWGLKQTRDPAVWDGGHILDPKSGKEYRCKLTVSKDGKSLDVRGYVGFSLFGRTQTWHRRA